MAEFGEAKMRKLVIVLSCVLFSGAALAETRATAPENTCVYRDRVFSQGSVICAGPGLGLVCDLQAGGGIWRVFNPAGKSGEANNARTPTCDNAAPANFGNRK